MKYKKATALLLAGALTASLMLGGCSNRVDTDDIVVTCGDQEFTLGYMNFLAHYVQLSYDSVYAYFYGDDYWTSEAYIDSEGKTMEERMKDSILEEVETESLLDQHLEDYGVVITEEDLEAMKAAGAGFMADNEQKSIRALGASEEHVADVLYYQTVTSRMEEAIESEVGEDLDIADYARRTFDYIVIYLNDEEDDENGTAAETNETLREDAEEIAEAAQEDFDAAAEEYGYTVNTYSYGEDEAAEDDGGFSEAVIEEADLLGEGEVSGVIEDDGCLYIIRLTSEDDEEAAESAMETARSEIKSEHFDEVVEGYKDETEFTVNEKLWSRVRFNNLFEIEDTEDTD